MTDMTSEFLQIQASQQTQQPARASKPAESKNEEQSFSKALRDEVEKSSAQASQNTEKAEQPQQAGQTGRQTEEQAAENGAMLMAEAMSAAQLSLILPEMAAGQDAVALAEGAAAMQPAAEAAPAVPAGQGIQLPAGLLDQPADGQAVSQQPSALPAEAAAVTALPADGQQADPQQEVFNGQTRFQKSVEMAQQLIRNSQEVTSRSRPIEINVDELQQKVDSKEFLAGAPVSQPQQAEAAFQPQQAEAAYSRPAAIDQRDVFMQIRAAADLRLDNGDREFTVRLRPEGLGEITVKLLSQDGRVTLSLAANDINVQKLLGSEIGNLREVMRPYNVEVSQVVESNETSMADLQQQLQQHSSQQFTDGRRQPSFTVLPDDADPLPDGEQQPAQPASALDAYI